MKMAPKDNSKIPDLFPTKKNMKKESDLVIQINQKLKISICKPLIPLKIGLALWFTASFGMTGYLSLLFTKQGLTVEEISFVYLTAYLSQFVVSTMCGVVSDKIGRPIYMVILSMFTAGLLATCLTFIPKVSRPMEESSSLYCGKTDYAPFEINQTCDKALQFTTCEIMCNQECCEDMSLNKFMNHSALRPEHSLNWCSRDTKTVLFSNNTHYLCGEYQKACAMNCAEYKTATVERENGVLLLLAGAILFIICDENSFRFLDILTNNMANSFNAEFGKQMFWSYLGVLVGPSLAALIIQQTSTSDEEPYYESSLHMYSVMALVTIATFCTITVGKTEPSQEMSRAVIKLFKNIEFIFFVFVLFVLGGTWGFLMNFHNLFLADIGTPVYMMGLLDTFSGLYGLPVMIAGKWLTDKIGHNNVFSLALLAYFVKCFGYSFIVVAWPVFFLELLMTICYHLLWVTTIDFCTKIEPDLEGTVVMIAGTVHFSLGRACGSFVGGLLMNTYGAAAAFRVMGTANGVAFLIYSVYRLLRRSRRTKKMDIS